MDRSQKLLTVKDVSALFNISYQAAYKIFHRRDFPSVKFGNRLYVKEDSLFVWFEKKERMAI